MILSAAFILLWLPVTDSPKTAIDVAPAASGSASETLKATSTSAGLPDAPVAKAESASDPGEASIQPFKSAPVKPAVEHPAPTHRQEVLWYSFMAAGHSAAAFDAWSTRRAISGNYGTESNPFLRPFAHSNAIYAATQVSPAVMDYLGRRMMTSSHPMLRRFWWFPQVAGAGFSFGSGMHNYSISQ